MAYQSLKGCKSQGLKAHPVVQLYRGQGIRWDLNPLLNIMALRAIFLRGIFKHFQKKSNFSGSWSHEYLPKKSGSKKSGCGKTSNRNSHQACWGASWYSIRNHGYKISKNTLCSKKMLWLGRTCHMLKSPVIRTAFLSGSILMMWLSNSTEWPLLDL